MARQVKLKITRLSLIAKLKAERDRANKKYLADKEALTAKQAEAAEKLAIEMSGFCDLLLNNPTKALKRVHSGYNSYNSSSRIYFRTALPMQPSRPSNKIDRLIRTLEAASDEYVMVSADDDFAAYL